MGYKLYRNSNYNIISERYQVWIGWDTPPTNERSLLYGEKYVFLEDNLLSI